MENSKKVEGLTGKFKLISFEKIYEISDFLETTNNPIPKTDMNNTYILSNPV